METEPKTIALDELRVVTERIAGIHRKMDYLATLTPEHRSRKRGTQLGTVKLELIKNRLAAARANPGLLPVAFDLAKFESDAEVCLALSDLLTILGRIWDGVSDTLLLIGEPVFVKAGTAHAHMKVASDTAQRLSPTERRKKGRLPVGSPAGVGPATTGEPSTPVPLPPPVTPFNPTSAAA